ncbi:SLATT domain-containing protein [Streptomyces sp. Amel2xB2]|uniref:SLATT domain-containing protein n=1 Tax=Streptomyces sp. Amel2xB2 TaxID=1305829 RepID=UPI0035CCF387
MSKPEMRPAVGRGFPLGDWGEPGERLDELYVWVEQRALLIADWYLSDRAWKRRGARVLRTGAALGATVAAVLPLLALTGTLSVRDAVWGYVALLGAVVCLCADRCFGLTTGWIRDVATAQAIQRRLEVLQYDWASLSVREMLGPAEGGTGEAAERGLTLLRTFTEDVSEVVRAETTDWMLEFRPGFPPATRQALAAPERPLEICAAAQNVRRFPAPPGARPSMPRQRPPEGPL